MKQIKMTIMVDADKMDALKQYDNDIMETIQAAVDKTISGVYEKKVPKAVREYLELKEIYAGIAREKKLRPNEKKKENQGANTEKSVADFEENSIENAENGSEFSS